MPRRRDHARERLLAILELLRLRDEAVRLDGIAETGGGLLAPRIEGFGLGQAIEAVVDFDRIELPRIISEPSFGRQIFGIEGAAPMPIVPARTARSEEHTSELQSLMRNSYAVFCLKKKT